METVLLWGATKGKGSGIGEYLARHIGKLGYPIILGGRNEEKLIDLSNTLIKEDIDASIFVSDFPLDVMKYTKLLEVRSVQSVISCIGTGYIESLLFLEDEYIKDTFNTNLFVNLDIIKKSIPVLKSKNANIIMLNSIAGIVPQEGSSVYTASKFALRGLIESLRHEIKPIEVGLSSVYFQNVNKIGIQPVLDCILVALKNKSLDFDFVVS